MHMVRGRDSDGVDAVTHFSQHLAKITVAWDERKFCKRRASPGEIDIAEGDDIFAEAGHGIAVPFAIDTDAGDAQFTPARHKIFKTSGRTDLRGEAAGGEACSEGG